MTKRMKTMNKSGITQKGDRVLVRVDQLEEKTAGGIFIPIEAKDRHQMSANFGEVVAIGADCWTHSVHITEARMENGDWRETQRKTVGYAEPMAMVGDRVSFSMYVGLLMTGAAGQEYKLINDEDIIASVTQGVKQTSIEARKRLS